MKIITFIYIFALYVLFIPGILIKNKDLGLLCSLLYSIILYFTLDIIRKIEREPLEPKMSDQNINVRVKNIAGNTIESQKKTAEFLIEAYENLYKIQANIEYLKKQLSSYDGTNAKFEILQNLYNNVDVTYDEFKKRLVNYNKMGGEIAALQNEVNISEVQETELQNAYNSCKIKDSQTTALLFDKRLESENMNKSILNNNRKKDILNGHIIEMQGKMPGMENEYEHMKKKCELEGFVSSIDVTGVDNLAKIQNDLSDKVKVQFDNDIAHVPMNFQTGNQLIKVLQSTSPSAMEELKLKDKIFDYKEKDERIANLRRQIVNLNDEIYQMQNTLTNYGNREIKFIDLKDNKVSTKIDVENLKHEISICEQNVKSNNEYIEKENEKIASLKQKQIESLGAYNETNNNNMDTLSNYNLLKNKIFNYYCPT